MSMNACSSIPASSSVRAVSATRCARSTDSSWRAPVAADAAALARWTRRIHLTCERLEGLGRALQLGSDGRAMPITAALQKQLRLVTQPMFDQLPVIRLPKIEF